MQTTRGLFLLVCAAIVATSVSQAQGQDGSCTERTECHESEDCIDGVCSVPCSTFDQCPEGFVACTGGVCVVSVTCAENCQESEDCIDGVCHERQGTVSTEDRTTIRPEIHTTSPTKKPGSTTKKPGSTTKKPGSDAAQLAVVTPLLVTSVLLAKYVL